MSRPSNNDAYISQLESSLQFHENQVRTAKTPAELSVRSADLEKCRNDLARARIRSSQS